MRIRIGVVLTTPIQHQLMLSSEPGFSFFTLTSRITHRKLRISRNNCHAAAAKSFQLCPTLCDPIDGSPPGSAPWDSPGKNTGVDCHFFLQCMKVKSESEVAQMCLTLCDPMDCSLPGSSVHGIFQARVLEWGAIAFSVIVMNSL